MRNLSLAISLAFSVVSYSAVASDKNSSYEIGVSAGQFNLKDSSRSYSGTSAGLNVVKHFNNWLSLEANYFTSYNLGDINDEVQARVLSVAPVLTYHINDTFSIYGKAGFSSMSVKSYENNGPNNRYSTSDWVYGFGLNTSITNRLDVRLGYEAVTGKTDYEIVGVIGDGGSVKSSNTKISIISLGLNYSF